MTSQANAKEATSKAASNKATLLRPLGFADRELAEVPPPPPPLVDPGATELEALDAAPWPLALDAEPPPEPLELPELPQELPPLLSTAIEPPSVTSLPLIWFPQSSVSDEPSPGAAPELLGAAEDALAAAKAEAVAVS